MAVSPLGTGTSKMWQECEERGGFGSNKTGAINDRG